MYPARVAGDSGLRLVCSQKNATLCAVARYAGFDSFVDEPRVYTRGFMLVARYAGLKHFCRDFHRGFMLSPATRAHLCRRGGVRYGLVGVAAVLAGVEAPPSAVRPARVTAIRFCAFGPSATWTLI